MALLVLIADHSQSRPGQPPSGGQQQGYGAPPPANRQASPQEVAAYKQILQATLTDNGLERSIFANTNLDAIAAKAPAKVDQLCARWNVPKEVGQDIVKLALYDIVIYIGMLGLHLTEFYLNGF